MKTIRKSITLRDDKDMQLKQIAKRMGVSQRIIIDIALDMFLNRVKQKSMTYKELLGILNDEK